MLGLSSPLTAMRTLLPNKPAHNTTPAVSMIATASFDTAATACRDKVAKIAADCRRVNRKYRDAHFDTSGDRDFCLHGLTEASGMDPVATARVGDIFEEPVFFKDGVKAGDIEQGQEGDCWFLAAVATATNCPGLLEKICVARDEAAGVYGFVFMRDGEWCSVIVDDQLFLEKHDNFHDADWDTAYTFHGKEEEYEKLFTRGSKALIAAKCVDPNETWLPLMEKAYAKIHGDYHAINGGYTGEGIEDLTGGVTTDIYTSDILDRDHFWKHSMLLVNKDFLFGAWTYTPASQTSERKGIIKLHAYSVLKAVEAKGKRFVLVRNPWGSSEWTGPWSDGSKEWDAEWLKTLDHKFGDDGQFWMLYNDFLRFFTFVDRTRLFDSSWSVTEQRWLDYQVPWSAEYADTRFTITVTEATPAVIVLAQLDDRYFQGLEGNYQFDLHFRVHKGTDKDYLVRTQKTIMTRSASVEFDLEPGKYTVLFKVEAHYIADKQSVREVVAKKKATWRKKFKQISTNADLAFGKAGTSSAWRDSDLMIAYESGVLNPFIEEHQKALAAQQAAADVANGDSDAAEAGSDPDWEIATEDEQSDTDDESASEGEETKEEVNQEKKEGAKEEVKEEVKEELKEEVKEEVMDEKKDKKEKKEKRKKGGKKEKKGGKKGGKKDRKHKRAASTHQNPIASAAEPADEAHGGDPESSPEAEKKPEEPKKKRDARLPADIEALSPETKKLLTKVAEDNDWHARVCVGLKVYSMDKSLTVELTSPDEKAPADLVDLDDTTRDIQPEQKGSAADADVLKKE